MFADDMILYIESRKDSTRKLLELLKEYSKVAGYKISTQKSLAFLYINKEKTEREIKEKIPFTIVTKRIKYLGINLPKETKVKVTQSCPTLCNPHAVQGILQARILECTAHHCDRTYQNLK